MREELIEIFCKFQCSAQHDSHEIISDDYGNLFVGFTLCWNNDEMVFANVYYYFFASITRNFLSDEIKNCPNPIWYLLLCKSIHRHGFR